jgi:dephospho-CoA kinase
MEDGFAVLEADEVGHGLLDEPETIRRMVAAVGTGIVGSDGLIDRSRLGAMVFSDLARLRALNEAMHPEILRRCRRWVEDRGTAADTCVVVPLLFETGYVKGWDAVVTVSCSARLQLARLAGRGHSVLESEARIAAQMPLAEKERLADYVVRNDGAVSLLRRQVNMVVSSIRRG